MPFVLTPRAMPAAPFRGDFAPSSRGHFVTVKMAVRKRWQIICIVREDQLYQDMKKEKKDMTQKNMKEQEKELEKEATDTPEAEKSGNEGKKEENRTTGKECDGGKESEEKIESLEKQVQELTDKIAKEKDSYIRLMAEFDNFRRRTSQEKLDLVSVAAEETIKGLLPVLDDCERAMEALSKSDDNPAAKEGTELIYSKLTGYLQSKGLNRIEAMGAEFDTDLHEAVAQFPVQEEDKKGKVFDVVQTGYTLNGKVVRFAKVVVGI